MSWKDSTAPLPPVNVTYTEEEDYRIINWETPGVAEDGHYPYYYMVYRFNVDEEIDISNTANIIYKTFDGETIYLEEKKNEDSAEYIYVVTSLDRLNNESTFVRAVR